VLADYLPILILFGLVPGLALSRIDSSVVGLIDRVGALLP